MFLAYMILSAFIIFYMNKLMDAFCRKNDIPADKQPQVLHTANVLTTILLISSYLEMIFL